MYKYCIPYFLLMVNRELRLYSYILSPSLLRYTKSNYSKLNSNLNLSYVFNVLICGFVCICVSVFAIGSNTVF